MDENSHEHVKRFRLPSWRLRQLLAGIAAGAVSAMAACGPASPPPPPQAAGAAPLSNLEDYRIQAGDVLGVRLLLNPDLDEDVVVRPDGHLSTTVVNNERASGRTVSELTEALTHDYTSIIRNPRLTVVLKTFSPTRIFVGGEVTNPGEAVTAGLSPTLSQAIARAGGVRESNAGRIFIIRRGPNNVPQIFSSRLRDVMRGEDQEADARLEQYDVVYVPRTGIEDVHHFLDDHLVQLVPEMWGFSYNVSPGSATAQSTR